MKRVVYDAVDKPSEPMGPEPPSFRSRATAATQLELELRRQPILPQTGPIFVKVDMFWEKMQDPTPRSRYTCDQDGERDRYVFDQTPSP